VKPTTVEIVPCRTKGITGYANVGRGSYLGNPYRVGRYFEVYRGVNGEKFDEVKDAKHAVQLYTILFYSCTGRQHEARKLLLRDWPDGVVRIACPCNGVFKGQPCHATVIRDYLMAQIEETGGEM
jgi:hypothetical protein